jgi:hypothetical protein
MADARAESIRILPHRSRNRKQFRIMARKVVDIIIQLHEARVHASSRIRFVHKSDFTGNSSPFELSS